jgi:AraC-like DNA-binding protein
MGMSPRTLTRRLSEGGMTFRALVQQTQERISRDLLQNSSDTIGEIAFQTGFSEQSAFSRAFKRWTGKSPLDYRVSP